MEVTTIINISSPVKFVVLNAITERGSAVPEDTQNYAIFPGR